MRMGNTFTFQYAPKSWKVRLVHLPMLLRCVVYALVVIVLARPQTNNPIGNEQVEGINIMLALDVSASMLSDDVEPNRIEAAKAVAQEFISSRPNDNIGLTIFAGEAFTQCPMTTDHVSLLNLLAGIRGDISTSGLIQDGTAIGMGVGEIDYKTLQNIAMQTDGEFYRAQSRSELSQIYKDIDKLEKTKLDATSYAKRYEAYMPFAMLALLVFFIEIMLRITVFKRIP